MPASKSTIGVPTTDAELGELYLYTVSTAPSHVRKRNPPGDYLSSKYSLMARDLVNRFQHTCEPMLTPEEMLFRVVDRATPELYAPAPIRVRVIVDASIADYRVDVPVADKLGQRLSEEQCRTNAYRSLMVQAQNAIDRPGQFPGTRIAGFVHATTDDPHGLRPKKVTGKCIVDAHRKGLHPTIVAYMAPKQS